MKNRKTNEKKILAKLLTPKGESLCGILKVTLEGTNLITFLIEITEKQCLWLEISLLQDENSDFGGDLVSWLEKNLIDDYFMPILNGSFLIS